MLKFSSPLGVSIFLTYYLNILPTSVILFSSPLGVSIFLTKNGLTLTIMVISSRPLSGYLYFSLYWYDGQWKLGDVFSSPLGVSIFLTKDGKTEYSAKFSSRPLSGYLYFSPWCEILFVVLFIVLVPSRGIYISHTNVRDVQ